MAQLSKQALAGVVVMMLGSFVSILNQNLMTTAVPVFMEQFSITSDVAQWLTTGYMLISGIVIPVMAFMIQRFSTRVIYFAAMSLFGLGCLVCMIAPSFAVLLAGRLIQAIGGGMLIPLMQMVLFMVFPAERRGTAMGVFGLVVAFAPAIGPTIAGWLLSTFAWQMLFAVMLPIIAIDLIAAFFLVSNVTELTRPSIDILSVALSSIGFGGLLYAFSMVGSLGWASPVFLATTVIAVTALVWFVVRQLRLPVPILEFRVFESRGFTVAVAVASLTWCAYTGAATLLPIIMQNFANYSPLQSGMALMAGGIVLGVMSPVSGMLFDRFGSRGMTVVGLLCCMAGTVALALLGPASSLLYIGCSYAVLILGVSMVSMPLTTAALNALPPRLISHGTAMNNTVRTIAGALATAVLVSVMTMVAEGSAAESALAAEYAGANVAFWATTGVLCLALGLALAFNKNLDGRAQVELASENSDAAVIETRA